MAVMAGKEMGPAMAGKKQEMLWIISELPQLQEQGVISPEAGARLQEHYQKKLDALAEPQKIFPLILGLIGVLMVAAGIVLFVNHNWDMLDKPWRIAVAALPLVIGAGISYFTIGWNRGQLWREASAVLTATGAATLIALLSQIYQQNGAFQDYMFLVLLLSLPLIYCFNSIALAFLYAGFLFALVESGEIRPLLLVAGLLPYLLYHLIKRTPWLVPCRYLALPVIIFTGAVWGGSEGIRYLYAFVLCSLLIAAGLTVAENQEGRWRNPWLIPAFLVLIVLSAVNSFFWSSQVWIWIGSSGIIYWVVLAGCLIGNLVLVARCRQERLLRLLPLIPVAIMLAGAGLWLMNRDCCTDGFDIFWSLYMVVAGVICLWRGWETRRMLIFNGGSGMLLVCGVCRFFDAEMPILFRSAGFILLGLGVVLANIFFIRKNTRGGRA